MSSRKKLKRVNRLARGREPGTPAGTFHASPTADASQVMMVSISADRVNRIDGASLEQIRQQRMEARGLLWIHVSGLGNAGLIRALGELFSLHRLALEDVVHSHQHIKADEYEGKLFIVTRQLKGLEWFDTQQLSIFIGENFVISFEEAKGDLIPAIAGRLEDQRSLMRQHGPDFLAYVLLDAVIDQYFPLLEKVAERLDELEDRITDRPERRLIHEIHRVRADLRELRRIVWQQRETLNALIRGTSELVQDSTRLFLRDCHDHTIQLVELIEVFHETCSDLRDIYLSSISNRMNEIMMFLTFIATIFIPLSFVAGLYGMNFNTSSSPVNMPELNWYYGYPFALALMATMAGSMIYFFYQRGWLGTPR